MRDSYLLLAGGASNLVNLHPLEIVCEGADPTLVLVSALEGLGFDGVREVRAGKLIELELADGTSDDQIAEMCRKLLANTVIENFKIERLENA